MADNRTISQLEAEGYPWIGCECCKGGRERESLRRICFLQIKDDDLAAIASSAIITTERISTTLSRHMIDRAAMFALTMIVCVDCTA